MITQLKEVVEAANAAYAASIASESWAGYIPVYEEKHMLNVDLDRREPGARIAYIEERITGEYSSGQRTKKSRMEMYFMRFTAIDSTAEERGAIREQIEAEIVVPFMAEFNKRRDFERVGAWRFGYPPPRYDAHEVGILLEFEAKQYMC